MTRRIIVRRSPQILAEQLPEKLHPAVQHVYLRRTIADAKALDYTLANLLPWQGLSQIQTAAQRLKTALVEQQNILIVGDFDADGATASAVAIRALRQFGADNIHYLVPNRFDFGYGLTPELVAVATQNNPDLIITVDNGIASHAGVTAANAANIDVIITDHHLPAATLPDALAIVNPNVADDSFASKNLAGVCVVFYLMLALRAILREADWFTARAEPNMAALLDLVALGTVADVVPLDANNRILVAQGLRRVQAGQCCAGISALAQIAGRERATLTASDFGFAIAPRLNAAGRLDDMSLGIECLLTDDASIALKHARRLDELNRERRAIEQTMQDDALLHLDTFFADDAVDNLPAGLCLFEPDWHQGVVGLVASRIKEQTHRPVIAFAEAAPGELKGSARSVPGLHIRDALEAVANQHPGLVPKFGGHAMAAGLSLATADLDTFRTAFVAEASRWLDDDALQGKIASDGELEAQYLTLEAAEALIAAGPWGQGFPEPQFDGIFTPQNPRVVGERHVKLRLQPQHSQRSIDAIAFNADIDTARNAAQLRVVYKLSVNDYQGQRSVQLMVEYWEPL